MNHNKRKEKKKKNSQWLLFVLCVIVGAIMGLITVKVLPEMGHDRNFFITLLTLMMGVFLGGYLQIIIHEAGHLVFGLLSGYKFSSFRISSLMIAKNNEKISVKFTKILGTGGQCLMVPPALVDGKVPYILYGLGGCIGNVVASLGALMVFTLFPSNDFIQLFFIMFILFGFLFALMNGIPLKMGMVCNDGYNVMAQKKDPEAMRAMWLQLSVNERLMNGESIRTIPEDWLYMPDDKGLKNVLVASVGVFYANKLMSMQLFDETLKIINRLLLSDTAVLDLHKRLLLCDKIYCKLLLDDGQDSVKRLYDEEQQRFMKQMKKFPSVLRTQYAIELLCNHSPEKAKEAKKTFVKVARFYPYQSDINDERALMNLCDERALL